jgi:hypothetical protein
VVTAEDVQEAKRLLDAAVPLMCDLLGLKPERAQDVSSLIQADYRTYVVAVHGGDATEPPRKPGPTFVATLAQAAHLGRTTLYTKMRWLVPALEDLAVALPVLLAARGDFVGSVVWRISDLQSPVGREAHGLGISGRQQSLYGPALVGGDMHVPAFLACAPEDADGRQLAQRIVEQLEGINRVAKNVAARAALVDRWKFEAFGLPAERLDNWPRQTIVLVPELRVGPVVDGSWPEVARTHVPTFARGIAALPRCSAVVAVEDHPYDHPQEWVRLEHRRLQRLLANAAILGLDVGVPPSHLTYMLRTRGDVTVLHRRWEAGAGSDAAHWHLVSDQMSHALVGFSVNATDTDRDHEQRLASALGFVEYLATSQHAKDCGARFGQTFQPSNVKAARPEQRALVRALRMISNTAVVAVTRERQARELGG